MIATEPITVDALTVADWPAVRAIYDEGIAGGNATFETEAPSWEAWDATHLGKHRVVAEAAGIWTLQAGVFPENEASLALHRSCGFRIVGVRTAIGKHHGVWRDVVFLERRSAEVG